MAGTNIRAIPSGNKRRNGRSGPVLAVNTPPVDHVADYNEHIGTVPQGVAETRSLRDWFAGREDVVARWAKLTEG